MITSRFDFQSEEAMRAFSDELTAEGIQHFQFVGLPGVFAPEVYRRVKVVSQDAVSWSLVCAKAVMHGPVQITVE